MDQLDRLMFGQATKKARVWVAKIVALNGSFLERKFLRASHVDYSEANSVGSRGVYALYLLEAGAYEVHEQISWSRWDRYYLWVREGEADRTPKEDLWLIVDT